MVALGCLALSPSLTDCASMRGLICLFFFFFSFSFSF